VEGFDKKDGRGGKREGKKGTERREGVFQKKG
jgi:hypothetical protein